MDGSLYLVLIAVMMVFGFSMLRRPKVPESVELLERLKQMQEKFDKFEREMRREVAETSR